MREGARLVAGGKRAAVEGKGASSRRPFSDGVTPQIRSRARRSRARPGHPHVKDEEERRGPSGTRRSTDWRWRSGPATSRRAPDGETAEGRHGVDQALHLYDPAALGGYKESGFGRGARPLPCWRNTPRSSRLGGPDRAGRPSGALQDDVNRPGRAGPSVAGRMILLGSLESQPRPHGSFSPRCGSPAK